jgi:xanthine dehydrogenase accessory factor
MKKRWTIWKLIDKSLSLKIPVILLYVLESRGSSPGRKGFFMAVNGMDEMEGSVGGGIMEHKFVEMARQILKENSSALKVNRQVHNKKAGTSQSGMICSGEQTLLIYRVTDRDKETVENILSAVRSRKNGVLKFSPSGLEFTLTELPATSDSYFFTSEKEWQYTEKIGLKDHLYIIGGGHCSLAFSRLMSQMDFHIHLFDNRKELNTMKKNRFAHEKKVIAGYGELGKYIPAGEDHYVVIMTFGYRTDDEALRALMDRKFKYLGMLGSKKKIEKMFGDYRAEGIAESVLQRIHAPVGLYIRSRTPDEIAISIAAQIVQLKNS